MVCPFINSPPSKENHALLRNIALPLFMVSVAMMSMPSSAAVSAPSFVTDEAVFWLDASTLSQLPGQEVTTWPDVRGEGHPVASTPPPTGSTRR